MSIKPDGSHESLPHSEHRPLNESFWRIVVPEVSVAAMRSMGALFKNKGLNNQSAGSLFSKLWNTPLNAPHQPAPNWRSQ